MSFVLFRNPRPDAFDPDIGGEMTRVPAVRGVETLESVDLASGLDIDSR